MASKVVTKAWRAHRNASERLGQATLDLNEFDRHAARERARLAAVVTKRRRLVEQAKDNLDQAVDQDVTGRP